MLKRQEDSGQIAVDFLIGLVIFAGSLFFVFQFMTSTILPYTSSTGSNTVAVHGMGDSLYYDRLSSGETGELNLSYFENTSNPSGLENEETLKDDLDIKDTRRLNLTVEVHNPGGPNSLAQVNGEEIQIGGSPPDVGTSVSKATRVGYWEDQDETVVIQIKMW